MHVFGKCEKEKRDSKIKLKENRSTLYFLNKNRKIVRVITVDGCAITEGPRCDYLVIDPENTEHFVELKGSDVSHAIEQLKASIEQISHEAKRHPKHAYIVCTKAPRLDTRMQRHKIFFKKEFSSTLEIKTLVAEVELT